MKRKGFTLIELLAVIVILAVIALIATPIILGIIDSSKKESFKAGAYGIAESAKNVFVKMLYSKEDPKNITFTYEDGEETSTPNGYVLNYTGAKPTSGRVSLNTDGKVSLALYDGKWCAKKGFSATDITLEELPEEECSLTIISGESIIDIVKSNALTSGDYSFITNGVTYAVEYINVDGNTTYSSSTNLGNATNDERMLVVKYNGNVTVNAGVTLTAAARKRGMFLYATGDITNNGTITMTARGASAAGQDVYLYKIDASTYDYVPAAGSAGGGGYPTTNSPSWWYTGYAGTAGSSRGTGGGGGGGVQGCDVYVISGAGRAGTSYSGGTGGGGAKAAGAAGSGEINGGAGGAGLGASGGGAGNPGGTGTGGTGGTGTGGLLIIRANNLINNGTISSNGSTGGAAASGPGGGGTGGGSVNLFYVTSITAGTRTATAGSGGTGDKGNGGAGGAGTVTSKQIPN